MQVQRKTCKLPTTQEPNPGLRVLDRTQRTYDNYLVKSVGSWETFKHAQKREDNRITGGGSYSFTIL